MATTCSLISDRLVASSATLLEHRGNGATAKIEFTRNLRWIDYFRFEALPMAIFCVSVEVFHWRQTDRVASSLPNDELAAI